MVYEELIEKLEGPRHIVVLPEMFTTGFSMLPSRLAEPMNGKTVRWMADMAVKHKCIITGSIMIDEDENYYNRMLWVQPDGAIGYYDKRHLFAYAGENKHYARGERRQIVSVNGWKINLQVCYDLRFPVWARNQDEEYDVLLYVANWPTSRMHAWKTLLQARAIENMCYVVGVNRVGKDGKNVQYDGGSCIIDPLGNPVWQAENKMTIHTESLDKKFLTKTRQEFPFLADRDKFMMI